MTITITTATKGAIDKVLDDATSEKDGVPGVIYAVINKEGKFIYEGAAGTRSLLEPNNKMTTDTIIYIASFTKLITTIAALQLVESGKVSLDNPDDIARIIPEVTQAKVISGEKGNFTYTTPKKRITLRMLLDHSCGFSYTFFSAKVRDHLAAIGPEDEFSGNFKPYLDQPLITEPDEEWNYGIGLDWAGVLVERISGLKLGDYFRAHIFKPLGLTEIHFGGERPDLGSRLSGMHQRDPEGKLHPRDQFPCVTSATFHAGGAGLVSSVHDYLKILNCLLNKGSSSGGFQILRPETVDQMFKDSLNEDITTQLDKPITSSRAELTNDCSLGPGLRKGWGLSFLVTMDELPTGRAAGSAWWAGIANCYYTVDRTTGIATLIATQLLPFADTKVFQLWNDAESELYKGLKS